MSTVSRPSVSGRGRRRPAVRALAAWAVLSSLILAAAPDACRADEVPVTWAIYEAPPFMIAEGPDRDAGIFDRVRHLLDGHLYGAPQSTLAAPFPRVLASLKDGAALCFIGGVETPERDGFAAFSLPVAMFYPMRIVVHAPERARFDDRAPLSLKALLADSGLRSSVLRDRSLGSGIDQILRQAPPTYLHSNFGEAFRMLVADRLDYLLEYSAIASYWARKLGQDGALVDLPFAEAPAPVFSRVMCPKTDWGRGMVARVDAVLRVERPTPAYRGIVEAWADPADVATIRDVYDSAFLKGE